MAGPRPAILSTTFEKEPISETVTDPSPTSPDGWTLPKPEKADYQKDGTADVLADDGRGINHKTMRWWHAGLIMIAETISLGILALPKSMSRFGFVPGVIIIIVLGLLATYSGYVYYQFKMRYPTIVTMADAGEKLFGPWGREAIGLASVLMFVFYMAAHVLTFAIMMNVLTEHATCSVVFGFVGFVASAILGLPRTLHKTSYLSFGSCLSILTAVLVAAIALGITNPSGGLGAKGIVYGVEWTEGVLAVMNIVMAYAGNVAFFGVISELKDPKEFPKALIFLQVIAITVYVVIAAVIYYFVGTTVPSPALGATGTTVQKVCYGIAIPTILVAGVINGALASKYVFIRVLEKRHPELITARAKKSYFIWGGIVIGLWFLSWLIAEAVPTFEDLVALVSSLFGSFFTYGLSGMFWLKINKGGLFKGVKKTCLTILNIFMIVLGAVFSGLGSYVSIRAIASKPPGTSFGCQDLSK